MAVVTNITAWSVGTNNEDLNVSNSGFTKNTSSAYSTAAIKVTNGSSPNSAYADAGTTAGYVFNTTPGSDNVTVKSTLKRIATGGSAFVYIVARASTAGDDWIGAGYSESGNTVLMVKCVNGSRTTIQAESGVSGMTTAGSTGELQLRVSGASGSITASVWWNGSQVGSNVSVTDAVFSSSSLAGIAGRLGSTTSTTGVHYTTLSIEDDTSGGGGGSIAPISMNFNRLRRA